MKRTLAIAGAGVLTLVGVAGLMMLSHGGDRLHARARKEWKERTIPEIARRVADTNWLASETTRLQARRGEEPDSAGWFTDRLILMTNGEWMVYGNKCSKEDRRIHDIFIGRGSDGKWYYSTFHFCIGMVTLEMWGQQPASLGQFVDTCFLREFDGFSDDCLRKTWPPERGPKFRFPRPSPSR